MNNKKQQAKPKTHRGQLLKDLVERYDPKRSELADHLGVDRASLYRMYANEQLRWSYLKKAADFFGHVFTDELPDMPPTLMEPAVEYVPAGFVRITECDRRVEVCRRENEQLKDQVIQLQRELLKAKR